MSTSTITTTSTTTSTTERTGTTWTCENCHHEIQAGRKRCTECGTSRF
jgi:hypothetical protein